MISLEEFVRDQIEFIEAERLLETTDAQAASSQFSKKELERRGLAITNLELNGTKVGFGGKTLLELERVSAVGQVFLASILKTGDIVRIEEQAAASAKKNVLAQVAKEGIEGVVAKVTDSKVTVALRNEEDVHLSGSLWLVKLANSITYDRMTKHMRKLQQNERSTLTRILLGELRPSKPEEIADIKLFDPSLNESQVSAVKHAVGSLEVALIHGPPGTGKTHTIIEIIRQLVKRDQRVLVCGPSNISVDNIVERLATTGVPLVRIGHPARLLPVVVGHSLDVLTKLSPNGGIVKDIQGELDTNLKKMTKTKGKAKHDLYLENKTLRKEYQQREKKGVTDVLHGSSVVLATLHGAGSYTLQGEKFDVVIIDEASQALEASCWIPLLTAKKAILAGDHMQLSPMIKSKRSTKAKTQPDVTLFERLLKLHGEGIKKFLSVQYRMNSLICAFPSHALYDDGLVAGEGVGGRLLTDLKDVRVTDDTCVPLIFIDTQGGDLPEDIDGEISTKSMHDSKSNKYEVELVTKHVKSLCGAGVLATDIAIVTPYSAQVALLWGALRDSHPDLEIGTVDGFQGREKEVVVVSLVRSNEKHEVGFLAEKRRLNVAMTRPKRQLCVIGDSETVGREGFMKQWMDYLSEHSDLRYPDM